MTSSRVLLTSVFCLAAVCFSSPLIAEESNVYVSNTTDSTVLLILDHVADSNGQKTSKSVTWTLEPNQASRLTITGEDLRATQVGFFVQTTFGARTPTAHGKVWFQNSEGTGADAKVQITITDNMVYKLPDTRPELQALLESLENSIEVLGREVRYYERLKSQANDDIVVMAINATAYFDALARYERAVSFHQAVVMRLSRIDIQ